MEFKYAIYRLLISSRETVLARSMNLHCDIVFFFFLLLFLLFIQIIAHDSRYARTYNFYLQLLFNKQSFKQSYLIITLHNLGSLCTLFFMVENLHNFFRNPPSDFIIMFMKLHNFLNSFLSLILKTILLLFRNITKVE